MTTSKHLWRVLDLPDGDTPLLPNVAYRGHRGHLWKVVDDDEVGCCLCVDEPDVLTLVQVHDNSALSCQEHGLLIGIAYLETHTYSIKVGGFERCGTDRTEDELLLPASLTDEERTQTVAGLFDECLAEVNSPAE